MVNAIGYDLIAHPILFGNCLVTVKDDVAILILYWSSALFISQHKQPHAHPFVMSMPMYLMDCFMLFDKPLHILLSHIFTPSHIADGVKHECSYVHSDSSHVSQPRIKLTPVNAMRKAITTVMTTPSIISVSLLTRINPNRNSYRLVSSIHSTPNRIVSKKR